MLFADCFGVWAFGYAGPCKKYNTYFNNISTSFTSVLAGSPAMSGKMPLRYPLDELC